MRVYRGERMVDVGREEGLEDGDILYDGSVRNVLRGGQWEKEFIVKRNGKRRWVQVIEEDDLDIRKENIFKGGEWLPAIKIKRNGKINWVWSENLHEGDVRIVWPGGVEHVWEKGAWVQAIKIIRGSVNMYVSKESLVAGDVNCCGGIWDGRKWNRMVEITKGGSHMVMNVNELKQGDANCCGGIWDGKKWIYEEEYTGSTTSVSNLRGMTHESVVANLDAMELESKVLTLEKFNALTQVSGKHYVLVDSDEPIGSASASVYGETPSDFDGLGVLMSGESNDTGHQDGIAI